jgi:protein gp37
MLSNHHGLPRIHHLQSAPARIRFLSVEALLEDLGALDLTGIHWVIAGGESGPGARLMR